MQTVHKRAAPTPLPNGNGTHSQNGTSSNNVTMSQQQQQQRQRRRKKRKQKPSQMLEDCMAVVLGFLILVGCAYWVVTKILTGLSSRGGGDDDGNGNGRGGEHGKGRHHKSPMDKFKPAPFNEIYHLPESHAYVGDRSDRYAKLRRHFDKVLPLDLERSMAAVRRIRDQQDANEYNVVPIVASESHGSVHHGGGRPRRHHHHGAGHNRDTQEVEGAYEENENDAEKQEDAEAKLVAGEVYDIYNCPDKPVDGYPYAWPILTLLDNWSPDDTTIPDVIYQGLCVFDYQKDYDKAMTYRDAELPFIVQNDPEVARTVERWNYPGYMQELLKGVKHRCEYSPNNHFMYHLPPAAGKKKKGRLWNKTPKDYKPPTDMLRMTYLEWLEHANITANGRDDDKEETEEDDVAGPGREHWYFRLIGCGLTGPDGSCDHGSSEYLFDELPYFQPVENLYLKEGDQQKGIHCRFGMKGVIAENHFDGSRNAIVLLGGSRRYILAHPDQCEPLSLFPNGHPSARHSQVDYTKPDLDGFPQFAQANANEVIMQPGDVLYLPTHWFHYIVSLEMNMQCNTRSGIGSEYENVINACGF